MIAEFYRPSAQAVQTDPSAAPPPPPSPGSAPKPRPAPVIVGRAAWDGRRVDIRAEDPEVEAALLRIFRAAPVVAEDPASRSRGTSGPTVTEPGSLEWFRFAALIRSGPEGLAVRLVASPGSGGWDPAANYRTFRDQVARLQS
ncbi:MAG: hypothetical protein LC722_07235 [Actinobacteria bacterium]|nr:hypothetical protein [Actinomycetota bacterium]